MLIVFRSAFRPGTAHRPLPLIPVEGQGYGGAGGAHPNYREPGPGDRLRRVFAEV
ncbi:hypothetical protein GCM10009647_066000 [Streptomyces sanglieri]